MEAYRLIILLAQKVEIAIVEFFWHEDEVMDLVSSLECQRNLDIIYWNKS